MSTEIRVHKPTRLLIEKNEKGETTKGRIEDATLTYVRLQDGAPAYGSETEFNYEVTAVVTADTAKNFKATFQKNGYRTVPNDQFTKSFRIDPPYPEQPEQYCIKLKSPTAYGNDIPSANISAGDIVPYEAPSRPKLYEIVDGKPVDITMTTRPANGSKGTVAFKVTTNKFGTFPSLSGVLVTELIESAQRANIASDFGITDATPATVRNALSAPSNSHDEAPEPNQPQPHSSARSEADWF